MKLFASLLTVILLAAGAASSSTLDFGEEANTNGERGGDETLTLDGVEVSLSAINGDAYLDSYSGGRPGGLGVCSTGLTSSAQCSTASDDNIDAFGNGGAEVAVLTFTDEVIVEEMTTRGDSHHFLAIEATILVSFDGGTSFNQYTVGLNGVVNLGFEVVFAGDDVQFKRDTAWTGANFYVTTLTVSAGTPPPPPPSPVPLPAGIVLLLAGLGGLFGFKGFTRRAT